MTKPIMTVPFVYVFFLPSVCTRTEAVIASCSTLEVCFLEVYDDGLELHCLPLPGVTGPKILQSLIKRDLLKTKPGY